MDAILELELLEAFEDAAEEAAFEEAWAARKVRRGLIPPTVTFGIDDSEF